jgi:glycine dehydrogenase subunit 2
MADYGLQHHWTSHHPYVVPEPFTLEPTESYSQDDLDEYAAVLAQVAREAREDPEIVKNAPHRCPIHKVKNIAVDRPEDVVVTWRQLKRD